MAVEGRRAVMCLETLDVAEVDHLRAHASWVKVFVGGTSATRHCLNQSVQRVPHPIKPVWSAEEPFVEAWYLDRRAGIA